MLVKFEYNQVPEYGIRPIAQQKQTIKTEQEFIDFFGVKPDNWLDDMTVAVSWDKQEMIDSKPKIDLQETAPLFFMYTNSTAVNIEKAIDYIR